MIYPQMLLDLHDELIVDLFAGGGGASCGIEMATGRLVDIAVNHDPAAVAMHQANHPLTRHITSDVFEADPREVTGGRPVGLLWASPDCTHHSKARGGKPLRDGARKRRALAWVVTRWAGTVRPRVIILENVEEFQDWGPLVGPRDKLRPDPRRKGRTFKQWVRSLERHGYDVEWRELRACDYGAPTIRKRLFIVARCDGRPIVWPEPTHGPDTGRRYRTAAECIDWSVPMLSIFATREEAKEWARAQRKAGRQVGTPVRPLADATMRRIARGVMRYVVESADPFIVGVGGRMGQSPPRSLGEPYQTITAKGDAALVAAFLAQHNTGMVGHDAREPVSTIVQKGSTQALVAAHVTKFRNGAVGHTADEPLHTITANSYEKRPGGSVPLGLVAAHVQRDFGASVGQDAGEPLGTITAGGGGKASVVASFLAKYYGTGDGAQMTDPAPTVTTKDRFGLVTVEIAGEPYAIVDIAMRMLQPRELYRAQGFPDSYIIDCGADGQRLTKTEQVRMVGNSVCPQIAAALVRANVPELAARDEVIAPARRRKEAVPA